MAEIELISATSEALLKLEFKDFTVRINDRRILQELVNYCGFEPSSSGRVLIILDKLDKIGLDGVRTDLIASNFNISAIDNFISIITQFTNKEISIFNLKDVITTIDEVIIKDLEYIINAIKFRSSNYSIKFDLSLVRGMGYYTGPIFEIEVSNYGSSIAGGGRYDKLIGKILDSKENIPACGFSIGFERVISLLEQQNYQIPNSKKKIVILFSENEVMLNELFNGAENLRSLNNIVLLEIKGKNLSKQLDKLVEQGFEEFAIFNPGAPIITKSLMSSKK